MLGTAQRLGRTYGPRIGVVAGVWIVMALWVPQFRGESGVYAVLENVPLLGLVALGLTATMIAGELDLSIASVAAIGGVVAVQVSDHGYVVALVLGTLTGTLFGIVQGYAIARLKINSLGFTIGSLIVLRGVAYLLAGGRPVPVDNLAATDIFLERHWIFSFASIVALAMFVVIGVFLSFVRYGRELYAVGGGRPEATAMGIPVTRAVTIAFAISGTCGALAGALATMKGGTADPASYENELLYGVAAALLGGIGLYGGKGTALHVLLGVALLGILSAGLTARGETQATTDIVTGVTLLVVVAAASAAGVLGRITRRSRLESAVT